MRDSRGPTAGSTVDRADTDHPELSVRFEEASSDLRAAIRHEMRGFIGALSLQLEIARRAQGRGDGQRVDVALNSLSDDLEALSAWNEMGERWLVGSPVPVESLDASSSSQLVSDLTLLLRVIGRRRRVTIEVEPVDPPDAQLAVDPIARASSLCFCVELLKQISASASSGRRTLTLRPASEDEAAGGLWIRWNEISEDDRLREWLALQPTILPAISLDLGSNEVLLRWGLRNAD